MKTNEIAGVGNWYTALFWEYNTRLATRMNPDPVRQPWESPYATFSSNPIAHTDVLGNESKTLPVGDNGVLDGDNLKGTTVTAKRPNSSGSDGIGLNEKALDAYVAGKADMDPTPASQRTGNKYTYAAYHLQKDAASRSAMNKYIGDIWAKADHETNVGMAKFWGGMAATGVAMGVAAATAPAWMPYVTSGLEAGQSAGLKAGDWLINNAVKTGGKWMALNIAGGAADFSYQMGTKTWDEFNPASANATMGPLPAAAVGYMLDLSNKGLRTNAWYRHRHCF